MARKPTSWRKQHELSIPPPNPAGLPGPIVTDVYDAVRRGAQSVLIQSPTGSGKGDTALCMAPEVVQAGGRVLYTVDRQELVRDVVTATSPAKRDTE